MAALPHPHIYFAIADERCRQERLHLEGKFTHTCWSPDFGAFTHFARVSVLGEEYGEVCRAALDVENVTGGRCGSAAERRAKLRKELIEVAAVAVAYIEGLDAASAKDAADERLREVARGV